ncbi:MAG: response regulator [Steroidobacteraceae bacterium]
MAAQNQPPRLPGFEPPAGQTPRSVLIADDHPGNRDLVHQLLELEGFTHIEAVATGREAIGAWERGSYDLLLLDWQMPDIDGVEATRRIRELETSLARNRTPIVIVTGHISDPELAACFGAGADECVPKPYIPDELLDAIYRVLRSSKSQADPPANSG